MVINVVMVVLTNTSPSGLPAGFPAGTALAVKEGRQGLHVGSQGLLT